MKLEITSSTSHPRTVRVFLDRKEITSRVINLNLKLDARYPNKTIITLIPEEIEINMESEIKQKVIRNGKEQSKKCSKEKAKDRKAKGRPKAK